MIVAALTREPGPDMEQDAVLGRVFKVSSLANGEVSLVFHVDALDADMALGYIHLRGKTVRLSLTLPE